MKIKREFLFSPSLPSYSSLPSSLSLPLSPYLSLPFPPSLSLPFPPSLSLPFPPPPSLNSFRIFTFVHPTA